MRHFLYTVYGEDDSEGEIIICADTIEESFKRLQEAVEKEECSLLYGEKIVSSWYEYELTEEEAENSGFDEL